MNALLSLENVVLTFGRREILRGISLALAPGEVLGILGPSGAGKSCAVRVALGLLKPTAGTVHVAGCLAGRDGEVLLPPEERQLGVVFQDLALWPHLTVQGHLEFCLSARRRPRQTWGDAISDMLGRVGLRGKEERFPAELSGGEQQRVAIARALITSPRAVLLDEPLSNLDVALKEELLDLFGAVLGERGAAALFVTHDAREAALLASRVLVLEEGRIVQEGTFAELTARPATRFVQRLVASLGRVKTH
jgi:iron(III) transport system ATP-binding protein